MPLFTAKCDDSVRIVGKTEDYPETLVLYRMRPIIPGPVVSYTHTIAKPSIPGCRLSASRLRTRFRKHTCEE
jgi:hypothetical protein